MGMAELGNHLRRLTHLAGQIVDRAARLERHQCLAIDTALARFIGRQRRLFRVTGDLLSCRGHLGHRRDHHRHFLLL